MLWRFEPRSRRFSPGGHVHHPRSPRPPVRRLSRRATGSRSAASVSPGFPFLLCCKRAQATEPSASAPSKGRAKSCIVLFFLGGPPQHETWDPKPDAPGRGPRRPASRSPSATPGLLVGELMPRTARLTDKIAVLRAVLDQRQRPLVQRLLHDDRLPHRADRRRERQARRAERLAVPRRRRPAAAAAAAAACRRRSRCRSRSANDGNLTWPGQDAGFLGRAADPWLLNCDPSRRRLPDPRPGPARRGAAAALRRPRASLLAAGQSPPRRRRPRRQPRRASTPARSRRST